MTREGIEAARKFIRENVRNDIDDVLLMYEVSLEFNITEKKAKEIIKSESQI